MPLEPNRTLAHYRLVERIAAGGMGEVYVAEDTKLHRKVALKVLPEEMAREPERRRRFEREAQAVAALNHPNIVTIHSVEEADGIHFLTMELVAGKTLSEHIPPGGLPLGRFLDVAVPLADALAAAHRAGIIHRDLKPANVMVAEDGRPKVLDFGLAKLVEPTEGTIAGTQLPTTSVTRDGKVVGTISYMAPEQAEGKAVDARSDVFSLGILLYEMATGERPFEGDTGLSVLSSILKDTPRPVSEVNPRLPRALARIIGRCLAKDPAGRFQSAVGLKAEMVALKDETESGALPGVTVRSSRPGRGGRRLLYGGVAVAALALAAGAFLILKTGSGESAPMAPTAEISPPAGVVSAADTGETRIVVLPLENLGPAEDAYFAAGMTEEITSRLSAVGGLAVISRTSALRYDRSGKTIQEVGRDLGVGYVLDGTVRWQKGSGGASRVRVTPQLIDVANDRQIWSDRYDRSMDDIFEVQSEIASQVVDQLGLTLLQAERRAVEARPTENLEAYQAYLRGSELASELAPATDWPSGIEMLERAVDLDPDFAAAWARLSRAHSQMYHFREDLAEDRLTRARRAADRALKLAPDLAAARMALGYYYYWGRKDYERALEEFERIRGGDDPEVLQAVAYIWRRLGRFEDAAANLERAQGLDPRNVLLASELAGTYRILGRWSEADAQADRALSLDPGRQDPYFLRAFNLIDWKGDLQGARALLDRAPPVDDPAQEPYLAIGRIWLDILDGRYGDALRRLEASEIDVISSQEDYITRDTVKALLHELNGEPAEARAAYEAAREHLEAKIREAPRDPRLRASLGSVYAHLGRAEDAVPEATLATDLYPFSRDQIGALAFLVNLAQVQAVVGDTDAALDQLEFLIARPGGPSRHNLELDPGWRPLRGDPRFEALKKKAR